MRKIDLNELYGGYWGFGDECDGGRGGDLEIKTLREHLEEWIQLDSYYCVWINKQQIQDILDGKITEIDGDSIEFTGCCSDEDEMHSYYDEVSFTPLVLMIDDIKNKAREQGIKPPETWYREEVDRIAYNTVNPDLPF